MTDVFIVRHGETESNRSGLWQGVTDSPLTSRGATQVSQLARRLRGAEFDHVITSDLGRAVATASAVGEGFVTDAAWREPDLGAWEGKTYDEVKAMSNHDLEGFFRGDDVRLGGAERLSETAERLQGAFRALIERVGPDGKALVVTHGLAIAVLTGLLFSTKRPNPLAMPSNTALVHLRHGPGGDRLHVHNDHTHLEEPPLSHRGEVTEVVFIRHGQTEGNLAGQWQGQKDGILTDEGKRQAKRAATALPELDALLCSRLARARDTAEIIGEAIGLQPDVTEGVEELGFGHWEGLTRDEIRERYPEDAARVFDHGEDLPRGGHGETWRGLVERITGAVNRIAAAHPGKRVGVVTHGGTSRAFVDSILGVDSNPDRKVAPLRNTAHATFAIGERATRILDWNIAPHLED